MVQTYMFGVETADGFLVFKKLAKALYEIQTPTCLRCGVAGCTYEGN